MNVLINLIEVIISQYICILNHHIVPPKCIQFLFAIIPQKSWGKRLNVAIDTQMCNENSAFLLINISIQRERVNYYSLNYVYKSFKPPRSQQLFFILVTIL